MRAKFAAEEGSPLTSTLMALALNKNLTPDEFLQLSREAMESRVRVMSKATDSLERLGASLKSVPREKRIPILMEYIASTLPHLMR